MHYFLIQSMLDSEDLYIHYSIYFIVIPRIMNELYKKFADPYPISPILIDSKFSKFRNSNSPPKSAKLYRPISIIFSDLQFNMWNDFDSFRQFDNEPLPSLLKSFHFTWVNELWPIFNLCNRFNPSIWNVCTDSKQSLPISIDSKFINRFKFNSIIFNSLLKLQLGIFKLLIDESNSFRSFNGIEISLDNDSFTSTNIRSNPIQIQYSILMMISHFQMAYLRSIHSMLLLAHLEYLYHISSFLSLKFNTFHYYWTDFDETTTSFIINWL